MPKLKKPPSSSNRKGLLLWVGLLFFVAVWMFVLGIFVGRGTAPVKFDMEKLQKELAALKEEVIKKELHRYNIDSDAAQNKTKMEFYETLPGNKAEENLKPELPEIKRTPIPEKVVAEPKITAPPEKTVEVKKATIDASTKAPVDKKPFTIQVASLKDPGLADKMVTTLKQKGFAAYRSVGDIPGRGTWYRVRVGSFTSKSEAAGTLSRLKKEKLDGIVVQR